MKCWRSVPTAVAGSIVLLTLSLAVADAQQVTNSTEMKLRLIEAGHYIRGDSSNDEPGFNKDHPGGGSADQDPAHPVRITKPFYVGTTEVTVGEFRKFVEATGYKTTAEKGETKAVGFKPVTRNDRVFLKQPFNRGEEFTWKNPGFEQTDAHPVVCVSWKDAVAYCRWLSQKEDVTYRLPTEAEWEYACRAGSKAAFHWGNQYRGVIHEKANIGNAELEKAHKDLAVRNWFLDVETAPGDGHVYTAPVGSFPSNAWGLYDMHGNVWEWCHDTYLDTFYQQYRSPNYPLPHSTAVDPVNEKPWNEFGDWRVIRGGSWYVAPKYGRSDLRGVFDAPDAACYIGFRVARDAPPEMVAAAKADWEKEQAAITRLKEWIGDFHVGQSGLIERHARFNRNNPPPEVSQDLYRISSLTGIQVGDVEPVFLQHASRIAGLKELNVNNIPKLTDADLAPLAKFSALEGLALTGRSQLTNGCVTHLLGLTNLKRLQLSGEGITDEGLARFRQLKKLENLNLRETKTQGAILTSLGEIPLQQLALRDLLDEHAERLAMMPELDVFSCRGTSLTERGFRHFAELKQLTTLDLRDCRSISADGFEPLRSLTKLKSLELRGTQAGDEAMRHLAGMYHLAGLAVGSENLTDAGMPHLCEAISLDMLTISAEAKITDEGLKDFWRLQRLGRLFLEVDGLTGEGFSTLAEASNINQLTIRSTALTDVGMDHISAMPSLRHLTISGGSPALTDKGLMMLVDAETLLNLEITVRGTEITDEAIEQLQRAKPDLKMDVRR